MPSSSDALGVVNSVAISLRSHPFFRRASLGSVRAAPFLALAAGCFVLYGLLALGLRRSGVFEYYNALFNGDAPRVVRDLTVFNAAHGRSSVHPLLPLFGLPLGVPLARLLGSNDLAALVLVASAGSGAVVLAHALFRRLTTGAEAWALTLFYATTASSLALFTQPETYAFSAFAAALMAYAVHSGARFGARLGAALLLVGTLVTNAAHVAAAELLAPGGDWRSKLRRTLKLAAVGAVVFAGLVVLELRVVPRTRTLAATGAAHKEWHYLVPLGTAGAVKRRLGELVAHFFGYAFVAPEPRFASAPKTPLLVTFLGVWHRPLGGYRPWSACAAAGVVMLLAWTAYVHARAGRRRSETWSVAFVLVSQFVLFLCYGDDLELYSPLWVIEAVLGVALALSYARATGRRRPPLAALYGLALLAGGSNVLVFRQVSARFAQDSACIKAGHPCVEPPPERRPNPSRPHPHRRRAARVRRAPVARSRRRGAALSAVIRPAPARPSRKRAAG